MYLEWGAKGLGFSGTRGVYRNSWAQRMILESLRGEVKGNGSWNSAGL